jgi:hypothetical protein
MGDTDSSTSEQVEVGVERGVASSNGLNLSTSTSEGNAFIVYQTCRHFRRFHVG